MIHNFSEGAITDRRAAVVIGTICGLRIAISMLDEQPALLFDQASGPNQRKRALELVPLEAEFQRSGCQPLLHDGFCR